LPGIIKEKAAPARYEQKKGRQPVAAFQAVDRLLFLHRKLPLHFGEFPGYLL
jgi:hypothetical protein